MHRKLDGKFVVFELTPYLSVLKSSVYENENKKFGERRTFPLSN